MPFVERDDTSAIKGVYEQRQEGYAEEFLQEDTPEVTAYREAFAAALLPQVQTFPADLWRRTSEDEAVRIKTRMAEQPVRLQEIFNRAQTFRHSDPDFAILRTLMVDEFGQTRADELLAPS